MAIVVFGSINMDICVYGERLPRPGETLRGERYDMGLGGKGCNQAVAVRRLGGEVQLVARLGDDEFGAMARRSLAEFGIADDAVTRDDVNATGVAVISIDRQGENFISVVAGANMAIGVGDVDRRPDIFSQAGLLMLQLEIPMPAVRHAADVVRAAAGRVILDPAPIPAAGLDDHSIFAAVDIMTPNELETEALIGVHPTTAEEAVRAAERLHERGLGGAIIKMGARGVFFSINGEQGYVAPFAVEAVDTVAAGDCFNGGLAFALARGDGVGEAVRFAAACGALATTIPGAAAAAPTLEAVESLMSSQENNQG